MMRVWLIGLCLMTGGLLAAPADKTAGDGVPTAESPSRGDLEDTDDVDSEEEATSSLPAAEQLRQRQLSDAFKNFKPSEEISADNAVSFPVDI